MVSIITGITKQLKEVSQNVFYLGTPNDEILDDHSIVFLVTNSEKLSSFENTEVINIYNVTVWINSASITNNFIGNNESEKVLNLVQPVKNAMNKVSALYKKCENEDFNFNDTLSIYTYIMSYNIHS